jgi:hypothetical protein
MRRWIALVCRHNRLVHDWATRTRRRFTRSCGDQVTGGCRFSLAVGGEQLAATDSDVWSIRFGSAADAASEKRHERPMRRVCKHSTGE